MKYADSVHVIALLEASRLTDRDLGQRVGVSQQSVNRWRRGEQVPGHERAGALAAALNVDVAVVEAAIAFDLAARYRISTATDIASGDILSAATAIVAEGGTVALTLRAVAEACSIPIATVAARWRTRDDLARAALDHALLTATEASLPSVLRAHLPTMARIGPNQIWSLPGITAAADLAGGPGALAALVGSVFLGLPISRA